jgi:hypothetical protein
MVLEYMSRDINTLRERAEKFKREVIADVFKARHIADVDEYSRLSARALGAVDTMGLIGLISLDDYLKATRTISDIRCHRVKWIYGEEEI